MTQIFIFSLTILAGLMVGISKQDWINQTLAMGLVLGIEGMNTAVEKLADFVHPDYHKKIGFIKDVSAGSSGIAAIISLIIAGIIYIPKIALLF